MTLCNDNGCTIDNAQSSESQMTKMCTEFLLLELQTSRVMSCLSHHMFPILYLPLQHLSIHLNSEIKMYLFIDLNNESKCSIKTTKSVYFRAYLFPRKICSWSCAMLSVDCWVAIFRICFDLVDNLKATVHMKKIKRSKKCRSLVLFAP